MKYIEDENKEDSIKKLAIKTSLDLLVKTRYFEEFSSSFLNTLKRISENEKASTDLRNISDYILHMVMSKKVSLRDGSCAFKFIL